VRSVGLIGAALVVSWSGVACAAAPPTFHRPAAPVASVSPASPVPPGPAVSSPSPLVLGFAGDVHFTGRTAPLLAQPATAFGPIAQVLGSADLTMVNLETAITDRGTEEPKQFHFRAPIAAFEAVRAAGVDVVTMANNHVLDYGQVGLADTLDNGHRAGFPSVGIGHNAAEAFAPLYTTVKGTKIAILAFSQVHELEFTWAAKDDRPGVAMALDLARATAAVRAARAAADVVIVFNHWGQEGNSCPTSEQKTFAGHLAAAGADLIIGSHAHTLQGSGWMGRTFVAYGLANFLWYGDSFSTETGVLKLTMDGRKVAKADFAPAAVSETGQPLPLQGDAATKVSQRYAGLRGCAGLSGTPS
jgi:poly-gamma-glutamate capsule biosynthesis protein CapA/YwtB (metallophosphatase superfamily)